MRWVLLCLALAACVDDYRFAQCGDLSCAEGRVCSSDRGCVLAGDVEACEGLTAATSCVLSTGGPGFCSDGGVCYAPVCGNGVTEYGEACDDNNTTSGDGCSSTCASAETCGNLVLDPATEECDQATVGLTLDGCSSSCKIETGGWRQAVPAILASRGRAAVATDTARGRIMLFGGYDSHIRGDTWEWDGSFWTKRSPVHSPPSRFNAAMAYDAVAKRMVLFGGNVDSNSAVNDTWLWDGTDWKEQMPIMSPPARDEAVMQYLPGTGVVLAGGYGAACGSDRICSDTWVWKDSQWTKLSVIGPKRFAAASVSAPGGFGLGTHPGLIVYGGVEVGGTVDTAWRFNGGTWAQITGITWPPPRWDAAMTYDGTRFVLFGGFTPSFRNDTWAFDGASWSQLTVVQPWPSGRQMTQMAVLGSTTYLYGGENNNFLSDMWKLPSMSSTWSAVALVTKPTAREEAAAAFDRTTGELIVAGGWTRVLNGANQHLSDMWRWNGSQWQRMTGGPPTTGYEAKMTYDRTHGCIVLFGEYDATSQAFVDDMWKYCARTWSKIIKPVTTGTVWPVTSTGFSLGFDEERGVVVLVANGGHARTYEWDGQTWTETTANSEQPPNRYDGALGWDDVGQQLILFGGTLVEHGDPADTWAYKQGKWTRLELLLSPPARSGGHLVLDERMHRLMLFGGGAEGALSDAWYLDGDTWRDLASGPPARAGGSVAYDAVHGQTLLFGGADDSETSTGDLWIYSMQRAGAAPDTCVNSDLDGDGIGDDTDGDGLVGCADPDCAPRCQPLCPIGTPCDRAPSCGDFHCDPLEDYTLCPRDCSPP